MRHMLRLGWLALTVFVCSTKVAAAQIDGFLGTWVNVDSTTRGITKLRIEKRGTTLRIGAWGKCVPSDCAWGVTEAAAYAPSVRSSVDQNAEAMSAVFATAVSKTLLIIHVVGEGSLNLEILTQFIDRSGRQNIRRTAVLNRTSQGS